MPVFQVSLLSVILTESHVLIVSCLFTSNGFDYLLCAGNTVQSTNNPEFTIVKSTDCTFDVENII